MRLFYEIARAADDAGGAVATEAPAETAPVETAPAETAAAEPAKPDADKSVPAWLTSRFAQMSRSTQEQSRRADQAERERDDYRARYEVATPQTEVEAVARKMADKEIATYKRDTEEKSWNKACNAVASAGEAEYPDFARITETLNATGVMKRDVIEAAMELGDAHRILYQLGKDPAEAARIADLSPARMAAALARLTMPAKAEAPKPVVKAVSAAPAPIEPVSGGNAGSIETDPEKMSARQYADWYDKRNSKK